MKQLGGWDIKLRKKMKNSLSIKVFLWVFSALAICSMLIYALVLTVLPRQYQVISEGTLEANTEMLVSRLHGLPYEDGVDEIYDFCIQNNSAAMLSDQEQTLNFGEIRAEELTAATESIACPVKFLDREAEYAFVVSSLSRSADLILSLMIRFLPAVLAMIFLLSFFSAFICSKVIVAPIAKISQISKRMTALDMTWKCDIEGDDEIGVLASSLNMMASRLQGAMEELTNANRQLSDDVERIRALEEQRRIFFAAVSHELKTPLTVLRGQIENMILGYGDFQNHEKYLPEALEATEELEHLVREIIALSKMESMDLQDTLQEVSLVASTNEAVQAILPIARDRDMGIHLNMSADVALSVNPDLWNKALSNIIGNAVRHSPRGEEVFISLQADRNGNVLVMENAGAHISEDDLPHLFTPFYRADKSRSKVTGGSGLGLYIVKTILDLHGMDYGIKNTRKGVAFSIYLN